MASDTRLRSLPKRTPLPKEEDARLESEDRRAFLRKSAAMAGGALAAGGVASTARAAPLAVPPSAQEMGRPIPPRCTACRRSTRRTSPAGAPTSS